MNEDRSDKPGKLTLLERLSAFLTREPEDRDELLVLLHGAFEHKLLDADALSMIEGVLQVSEMTVRDIMIPRAQMDVVSIDDAPDEFLPLVLETRHSRFPVIGENKDDVVGILLAKELLLYYRNPDGFDLKETLRPAVFVPESKRSSSTNTAACPASSRSRTCWSRSSAISRTSTTSTKARTTSSPRRTAAIA
jgi:magnesium and cobalt transporter